MDRDRTITLRLREVLLEHIKAEAQRLDVSSSQVVRRALVEYFERHK